MYQVLLTIGVVLVVLAITRGRRAGGGTGARRGSSRGRAGRSAVIGYSLLALLVVGAIGVFYAQWRAANEIVSVQVLDTRSGSRTTYQVYRKDLDGRTFHTVDGRFISLSGADRMELMTH